MNNIITCPDDDQILALKNREPTESINLNIKETEGSCSNRSENSSDIKLDISRTPAIDSPSLNSNHPITSRPLFPTSNMRPNSGVAQLFQNSSSSARSSDQQQLQYQKLNASSTTVDHHHHHHHVVKEESSLSNMFCAIDDQSGFWPWLEQQHFN